MNQTVKLPRWRKLASYSRQFVIRHFCLGLWWRRSWFSLKGKIGIRGQVRVEPPTPRRFRTLPRGSMQQGRLCAYFKVLPDFDDVIAEERAMEHALRFGSVSIALHFLHAWPAPRQAACLVLDRHAEIDGNLYYLLDPAARWLKSTHPLAATLLRRAMIEDTLDGAKSKRYRHVARHLAECRSLAPFIGDYGQFETHKAFAARLRSRHGRKTSLWTQVTDTDGT